MLTPEQIQNLAAEVFRDMPETDEEPDHPLPERIGEYRILRLIGVGGMGAVYEAEQEQPRQRVAIKVLKRDLVTRSASRRFRQEAELLARLHHPYIAHIHKAGTHDDGAGGIPYFVMEFIVDAQHITQYADDHQLDLPRRLELFAQVCDAVNYGHQNRVIHRDLKPRNILVDGSGLPKIVDFGIACATDADVTISTLHTSAHSIIGTLQYMSPEQAVGGVSDIRTDTYALGVVLYELVCQRLPYVIPRDASITAAARIIEQQDPLPPTTKLLRKMPRDLVAVMMKALAKRPAERFQSAADLAADVRRYLRGEPVEARRPSRWVRSVRWLGRHPIATTVAACLTIIAISLGLFYVTMIYNGLQPARFQVLAERVPRELLIPFEMGLYSRNGTLLDRIGGPTASITFAHIVPRPARFGGGDVALFAVEGNVERHSTGGQLHATPSNDLVNTLWQTTPNLDVPDNLLESAESFRVSEAQLIDVFSDTEHEGHEIVVTHICGSSASTVRIHDLTGAVLFEFWHWGPIRSLVFMPENELLIVTADRHGIDWEKARSVLGEPDLSRDDWPQVVFAVKPTCGLRLGWINEEYDLSGQQCLKWYKSLLPFGLSKSFELRTSFVMPLRNTEVVNIQCQTNPKSQILPRCGIGFRFDSDGQSFGSPQASDGFIQREADGVFPPRTEFTFGKFPEVAKPLEQLRDEIRQGQARESAP